VAASVGSCERKMCIVAGMGRKDLKKLQNPYA
jgi:hypothetical protein